MARTFTDVTGNKCNLDALMEKYKVEVDCDIDIVTGGPSGYVVLLDGEEHYNVNKEVYTALKEIL